MTKDQLQSAIADLLTNTSLGEVLDALQDEALWRAAHIRGADRLAAATFDIAALKVGEAARYCLNMGI